MPISCELLALMTNRKDRKREKKTNGKRERERERETGSIDIIRMFGVVIIVGIEPERK